LNTYLKIAFGSLALSVILGAFGAHAWKEILIGHESTFELANDYQIWLSLAILIVLALYKNDLINSIYPLRFLVAGMILFSGSLYMLSFPAMFGGTYRSILGPLTPIGGLLIISSWILLFFKIKMKIDKI